MKRLVPVALLSASLLGCFLGPRDPGTIRRQEPVRLTVQNQRFEDATIHAHWKGGPRRRVGMVTGMTSQTFTFEWVADVIQFEVDFIAAEDYMVDAIDVQQGDHLDLVILNIRP
jgi:hypothetical protein